MTIRTTIITYRENKLGLLPFIEETCILQYHNKMDVYPDYDSPAMILIFKQRSTVNEQYTGYLAPVQKSVKWDLFAWLPNQTIEMLYAIKKHRDMYANLG